MSDTAEAEYIVWMHRDEGGYTPVPHDSLEGATNHINDTERDGVIYLVTRGALKVSIEVKLEEAE